MRPMVKNLYGIADDRKPWAMHGPQIDNMQKLMA